MFHSLPVLEYFLKLKKKKKQSKLRLRFNNETLYKSVAVYEQDTETDAYQTFSSVYDCFVTCV